MTSNQYYQLLKAHSKLYFGFGKPDDITIATFAKSLTDQGYPIDKLTHALSEVEKRARDKFPSMMDIKIAGDTWKKPAASDDDQDRKLRERRRAQYEKNFEEIYTKLGHEQFVGVYRTYLEKVLNVSDSVNSVYGLSDQLRKNKIDLREAIFTMLMIRHYKQAGGDIGKMVIIGKREK